MQRNHLLTVAIVGKLAPSRGCLVRLLVECVTGRERKFAYITAPQAVSLSRVAPVALKCFIRRPATHETLR